MSVHSDTRPAWSIAFLPRRRVLLTPELTCAEADAYDQFVATAPSGHYSQTRAWARVAVAERSVEPLFFLVRHGSEVIGTGLALRPVLGGVPLPWARIEHGPVTAMPEDLPEVLASLRQSCLARGILRLSVRPCWTDPHRLVAETLLGGAGFVPQQRVDSCLTRVKRLDLSTLDDKKSWSASHLVEIRREIGRAAQAGATVRPGRHEDLVRLQTMAGLSGAWTEAYGGYFLRPGASMFVSEFQGALVSAIFVTFHKGLATLVQVLSTARPLPFSPTVLAATEAMQWARRMGAQAFEDEGYSGLASYCRTEFLLVGEHVRWLL